MRHKDFWIALGIGALAGGVAVLLTTPQSGAKTRKQLKRGLLDAGDALEDASDYLRKQAETLSKEAQKLLDTSKDKLDAAVDAAGGYLNTATKAAKAVQKLV